jgi:phage regulator Rha-like protein
MLNAKLWLQRVLIMNEIIISQIHKELRTDSRLLAPFLDHRHRTILESIDKYSDELRQLGHLPFQTEGGLERPQGGYATIRYALLNEDQCFFLLTIMRNNARVVACKLALVKSFSSARKQLATRDLARLSGKKVRLEETDAIKELKDYAEAAGSQNASKLYIAYSKLANNICGVKAGERDSMDARQLSIMATVEMMIKIAIQDGIKAEMDYHDIYQMAKYRCGTLSGLIDNLKIAK